MVISLKTGVQSLRERRRWDAGVNPAKIPDRCRGCGRKRKLLVGPECRSKIYTVCIIDDQSSRSITTHAEREHSCMRRTACSCKCHWNLKLYLAHRSLEQP